MDINPNDLQGPYSGRPALGLTPFFFHQVDTIFGFIHWTPQTFAIPLQKVE